MKAAIYYMAGEPHVLQRKNVEDPAWLPDGVLIRIAAVCIEGGNLVNRASATPPPRGHIPGYAVTDEVISVSSPVQDRVVRQKVASFDLCGCHAAMSAVQASKPGWYRTAWT